MSEFENYGAYRETETLCILLKRASLEVGRVLSPYVKKYDLTVTQYKFLRYLFLTRPEPVRVTDLESYYSMSHPAVIDVLKVLEKKGYTTRETNPADGRSKIVCLTDKALALQPELDDVFREMDEEVSKKLSGAEREILIGLLNKFMGS